MPRCRDATDVASRTRGEVMLSGDRSASQVLHDVLSATRAAFPDALDAVRLPEDGHSFRATYPDVLTRFEAARLATAEHGAIARHALAQLREQLVWQSETGTEPLHEALARPAAPLPLERLAGRSATPGWHARVSYAGNSWAPDQLAALGADLVQRGMVTPAAGSALRWLGDHALEAGRLHLQGRRIALLGAGAEMAPTRLWLEAGADVLWLDTQPPPQDWLQQADFSGSLTWSGVRADLLTAPHQMLATLIEFADGQPLDLGLYAYAPGQARELRLTCAMNALVDALPVDLVGSITLLVSPTTPTALDAQDLAAMAARLRDRPAWEALLAGLGLLGRGGGCVAAGERAVSRTVVAIQGASYQAAQYLGKVLAAAAWTALAADHAHPRRVSANTAAITRTRSLDHPVFTAAFGGAAAFGVETWQPHTSRTVNGLLAAHDWLHPDPPLPGRIRVHGGIHTLPYPLDAALRVAAAIGLARSPALLARMLRRRRPVVTPERTPDNR